MAAAIIGWAAEEFSFTPPQVDITEPLAVAEHSGSIALDALPGPRDGGGMTAPAAIEAAGRPPRWRTPATGRIPTTPRY